MERMIAFCGEKYFSDNCISFFENALSTGQEIASAMR
jgi:hypothetical protein